MSRFGAHWLCTRLAVHQAARDTAAWRRGLAKTVNTGVRVHLGDGTVLYHDRPSPRAALAAYFSSEQPALP